MPESQPQVEARGYIGGQADEFGGFCQPLVIRVNDGEHYVLHEMHTYRDENDRNQRGDGKIKARHSKVEFDTLDALMAEFEKVEQRLGIDRWLPWIVTDAQCGYAIPAEFFVAASVAYSRQKYEGKIL